MPDFGASFRGEAEGLLCVGECLLEFIHVAVSVWKIEICLGEWKLVLICQWVVSALQGGFQVLNTAVHVSHHVCMLCHVVQHCMHNSTLFAHNHYLRRHLVLDEVFTDPQHFASPSAFLPLLSLLLSFLNPRSNFLDTRRKCNTWRQTSFGF